MMFEMRLELAKYKNHDRGVQQTMASEQASAGTTNYVFHIEKVDQLNANVRKGAEVVHTMKN